MKRTLNSDLNLTTHFAKGLAKHGLSIEDMENYKYCGGDTDRHFNYWKLVNKNNEFATPPHKTECICGHAIEENCYIMHKTEKTILILGNCCIEKFVPDSGRTCEECGDPHQNRKVNRCNVCRIGKCDICDKKCDSKYDTCYGCKQKHISNTNKQPITNNTSMDNFVHRSCKKCNKEIKSNICDCNRKFIIINGIRFNICIRCNETINKDYNKCYSCNKIEIMNTTIKCSTCDKRIDPKYKQCYACKFKNNDN